MGRAQGHKFSKGRSKKDTWKKLQHPDVEDFLKEQREDERLGIREKTDDQLFILDQDGSDSLLKAANEQPRRTGLRKRDNKEGPLVDFGGLRCFQILKPHSAVKDPVIKRNRKSLPGEKKTLDMKLKDEIRRYRQETQPKVQAADTTTSESDIKDPWSAPDSKSVEAILTNEWLKDETKRNMLRNRSLHKVKKPTTQLKAIDTPHPGLSVNPSFADHQDILRKTVEITQAEIKKEQKLIRATAVPKSAKEEDTEEDPDIKEEIEVKSEPESDTEDSKNGIFTNKPKTKQQRRKARELSEQLKGQQEAKDKRRRENEIFRTKQLNKEIRAAEKKSKEKIKKKVDKKIHHEKYEQLVLSQHKFKPLKPDPLLSEEMGGSLLTDAKNSIADLTLERFKSLQKRNLIEPRVKQRMERKYKLKKYQRPSEKMEWEVTGMWNGEKLLNPGDRKRPLPRKRGPQKKRRF